MKYVCAFLGGALAGAAAALLMAPQKGEDTRAQIIEALRRYGVIKNQEDEEVVVEQIAAEIKAEGKKKE